MDLHVIWRGVVVRSTKQINIAPTVWVRILHEHIYLFMFYLFFPFFTCRYRYSAKRFNINFLDKKMQLFLREIDKIPYIQC